MVGSTLDFTSAVSSRDGVAVVIGNFFDSWNIARQPWLSEISEIRNYVFATDTTSTSNKVLPWKNTTTIPKLCQIRDNLHANYMAALFPHADWLLWEGDDAAASSYEKRKVIQSYMENKTRQLKFRSFVSQLIYDYIDYGNVFAGVEWAEERYTDPLTSEVTTGFVGAKPYRISPLDIVFNPTAATFEDSPKIIRSLKTIGEFKQEVLANSTDEDAIKQFDYVMEEALGARRSMAAMSAGDQMKANSFQVDGFGTLSEYYKSGYVEILTFFGNLYDVENDKMYPNSIITVIDRSFVVSIKQLPLVKKEIIHVGWRLRPDNLYAMSPLANLVGMQYRIDHLENLKADVFDLIAFPVFKIRGNVDDFEYAPNARIFVGEEGDVEFMHPDTTALNANNEISALEAKMEEMAGAPKQAMGVRTPGEKTAYEVQSLENAANRIFMNKISYFEEMGLESLLNLMLKRTRDNMSTSDLIRTLDSEIDVVTFTKVTKEDLSAKGKLRPVGAAHFARRNNLVQNLTQLLSSSVGQDPAINVHISGLKTAKLMEQLLDVEKFGLVSENIRITENAATQRLIQSSQDQLEEESITPAGINPSEEGDFNAE